MDKSGVVEKIGRNAYIAEGRGICGHCCRVIAPGDVFYWRSGCPASTECELCREKRLRWGKKKR